MARYKDYCYEQDRLIPVSFHRQIVPGTFEYTLSHLIDQELDLSAFDACYQNDETGAPAYDPRILLKLVLFAYSRGIFSSRRIEQACRENVLFMALSADSQPHWTTIADFISGRSEAIGALFQEVLLVCDSLGLLGKELFAIDGCKLSSNASKEWSGTHADLRKKQRKLERVVRVMLARHRQEDAGQRRADVVREREAQYLETVRARVRKIKTFLAREPENCGPKGTVRQVVFFRGRAPGVPESFTSRMQRKVDSVLGKVLYGRRLAVAEPPFADIRHAKGLSRFTLRGRTKVNGQWQLYCLVHNLFKVHRFGEGFT